MNHTKRKTTLAIILILLTLFSVNICEAYLFRINEDDKEKTALILNPAEYVYGKRHCEKIKNALERIGYTVVYKANEEVDLNFIKNNLSAEIIYINTHAGYWDTDGDNQSDAVVIATGEKWTENTPEIYEFEYNNSLIVKGEVGEHFFVAFTPSFIEYYYQMGDFPDSLVYMATCHAAYDDSMADKFLNAGAGVYVGWDQTTMFWTNSITSNIAFKLLSRGFTVKQVCRIIRSGGLYNFIFRSKLTYYGNENFVITAKT